MEKRGHLYVIEGGKIPPKAMPPIYGKIEILNLFETHLRAQVDILTSTGYTRQQVLCLLQDVVNDLILSEGKE